jgi:hypothetical protein
MAKLTDDEALKLFEDAAEIDPELRRIDYQILDLRNQTKELKNLRAKLDDIARSKRRQAKARETDPQNGELPL